MPTMYSSEFLLTHEVVEKIFKDKKEATLFKKKLQKEGYKVKIERELSMEELLGIEIFKVVGIRKRDSRGINNV